MPLLCKSGRLVIDASTLLTKKLGKNIIDEVKKRKTKIYISDTLEAEYERNLGKDGVISPEYYLSIVQQLERLGLVGKVKDKELKHEVFGFHDAHLINLALTVKACAIISGNKHLLQKAEKYGIKALTGRRFLSDC